MAKIAGAGGGGLSGLELLAKARAKRSGPLPENAVTPTVGRTGLPPADRRSTGPLPETTREQARPVAQPNGAAAQPGAHRAQPSLEPAEPALVAKTQAHRADFEKQARDAAIRAGVEHALQTNQPLGSAVQESSIATAPNFKRAGKQVLGAIAGIPYGAAITAKNAVEDAASVVAAPGNAAARAAGAPGLAVDAGKPTHLVKEGKQIGKQIGYDFSKKGRAKQGDVPWFIDLMFGGSPIGGGIGRLGLARDAALAAGEEGASTGARLAAGAKAAYKGHGRQTMPISRKVVHETPEGPVENVETVHKLLSPNPLFSEFVQKPLARRMQAQLDEGPKVRTPPRPEPKSLLDRVLNAAAAPKVAAGNVFDKHLSAETRFGRELRADRRVNQAAAQAPLGQLSHAAGSQLGQSPVLARLPKRIRVGLSRGEEKLLQVVNIEGDKVLDNPAALDQAITGHSAEHDNFIANGESSFHHTRQQGDLELARAAAKENLSPAQLAAYQAFKQHPTRAEGLTGTGREFRFLRALDLVRELGARREAEYIQRGLLKPENARWRLAAQYAVMHGEPLKTKVTTVSPGKVVGAGPAQRRTFLEGEVAKLDKQVEAVQRAHTKATARTRPRTVAEAASRLHEINQTLDRAFMSFFGHGKLDATQRAEQLRRNRTNGLIDLFEKSGVRKRGTHAALREGRKPTVLGDLRKEAMQSFDKMLADKQHPLTDQILKLRDEADQLEQGLRDVEAKQFPHADEFGLDKGARRPLTIGHDEKKQLLGETMDARSAQRAQLIEQQLTALKGVRDRRAAEIQRSLEQSAAKGTLPQQQVRYGEHEVRRPAENPDVERHLREAIQSGKGIDTTATLNLQDKIARLYDRAGKAKTPKELQTIQKALTDLQPRLDALRVSEAQRALKFYDVNKLHVPEGATYTPLKGEFDAKAPTGQYAQPGRGANSIPPTGVGRYDGTVTHDFTGDTVKSGNYVVHTTRATAESYNRMVRLTSALDLYSTAWKQSTAVKRSKYDVAIREKSKLPAELRQLLQHGDENLPLKQSDLQHLNAQELDALQQHLHPTNVDGTPTYGMGIGADLTGKGVRWVDSRILADLGDLQPHGGWVKVADAINNPIRFLAVYGRVAYILNLPGNLGMQVLHQGFMAPGNYTRAITLRHDLIEHLGRDEGERVAALAEHFVGEGRSRAFAVDTGWAHKPVQAVANFWSSFIDRYSRLSALVHEMRAHGVEISANPAHGGFTKDEAIAIRDFLDKPSVERTAAVRRANKQLVEFGNLTPVEKNVLRHLIFLYPWVSRATVWSLRYAIDHPGSTFALEQLGRLGADELEKMRLPSYLADKGYFPAFWKHGEPYLVNPTSINTFQTAADNARVLMGLIHGGSAAKHGNYSAAPRDVVAPIVDLAVGALQGQTSQGRPSAGIGASFLDVASSIPEVQMLQRGGVIGQPKPNTPLSKQRVFQGTGLLEAFGPFGGGGMFPRRASLDVAGAKHEAELRAGMGLVTRTRYDIQQGVNEWKQEAVKLGLYRKGEKLDPALTTAIAHYTSRQVAYASEAHQLGIPLNHLDQKQRLRIDYDLLVKMGVYPKAEAEQAYKEQAKLTDDNIKNVRRQLHADLFGQQQITDFKRTIKESGGTILSAANQPPPVPPDLPEGIFGGERPKPANAGGYVVGHPAGLIAPGNIDLNARPTVHNADGSISTVRSITVTDDQGRAILIPTVIGGRVVSDKQAVAYWKRTGENLGTFDNEAEANAYAQQLHRSQAKEYATR